MTPIITGFLWMVALSALISPTSSSPSNSTLPPTNANETIIMGVDGSIPPGDNSWTLGKDYPDLQLQPGTIVVFNWSAPIPHGIAFTLDKAQWDACSGAEIIVDPNDSGSFSVNASEIDPGTTQYFYCPVGGHCAAGMKVSIAINSTEY